MPRNRAERGLGARLIAKWSVDAEWGWRSLRNEKPRMGVRGSLGRGMDGLLGDHLSEQGSEGECGGLGDNSVAEEAQSVHPIGSPIIASTNDGFNGPACCVPPLWPACSTIGASVACAIVEWICPLAAVVTLRFTMIAFAPSKDRRSTLLAFPVAAVLSSPRRAIASNVFDCWLEPFNRKLSSFAQGVGRCRNNEDSLALMRRTNFSRAEYSPRCFVTQLLQIADDAGESHRDVALDVLKKDNGRSD
jgi:hypothetical protein